MGATTQKAVTKRRGRPIVSPTEENDALKTRRERNREAQHVFRKRRQAAEAAQEKRMRRLEDVVEEMSSIFMRFADDMLGVEVVTQNACLVDSLRCSMAKILALAQEVVEPDDQVEAPSTESPAADEQPKQSPEPTASVDVPVPDSTTLNVELEDAVEEISTSHFPPPTALSVSSNPFLDSTFQSLPPQIFGNGWPNIDALQYIKHHDQATNYTPVSFSDNSFTLRLTETTVALAYLVLTDSASDLNLAPGTAERMFSSTLRIRPRHLVTYKLRWLLGPGRPDIHLLSDVPFAVMPMEGWAMDEKTGQIDIDAMTAAAGVHVDERWASGKFLSAVGVYQQLLELGARMVGPDTMELNIPSPPGSPEHEMSGMSSTTGSSTSSSPPREQQPESWSFVNFFPDYSNLQPPTSAPAALTMRLSVSVLINNLAGISVCLARGPGFPKQELGKAIEASVTGVQGGEEVGVY